MSKKQWLTVAEVGEITAVPVETIRRYIRTHGVHLKVKKINKRYQIHKDSVDVFKQIREFYDDGMVAEEIEQTLTNRGVKMTVTVESDDDRPMTVNVGEELQKITKELSDQKEFNKLLLERLDARDRYIDEHLEKRDRLLMETMNDLLENKREAAAVVEENEQLKKKGWFARLFDR